MSNKTDPAGTLAKGLQQLTAAAAAAINVALPCKVLTWDGSRATIQPLIQTGDDPPAVIAGVPALGHRLLIGDEPVYYGPMLEPGDVVLVVFCDRQIRDALGGRVSTPESPRQHARQDAVIVGVMT